MNAKPCGEQPKLSEAEAEQMLLWDAEILVATAEYPALFIPEIYRD